MAVDKDKVVRLAFRLMKATLKHQSIRAGDYRRSELEHAEQTMTMARNRLFDSLLLYEEGGETIAESPPDDDTAAMMRVLREDGEFMAQIAASGAGDAERVIRDVAEVMKSHLPAILRAREQGKG